MTAKTSAEREKKQAGQEQSLKGALAGALQKNVLLPVQPKKPFEVAEDTLQKVLKGEA